jgi:BolA protein
MTILELIRSRLATLDPVALHLVDDSHLHAGHAGAQSGGGHYALEIVSTVFAGRATIARHRMIYDLLGDLMPEHIHALSITARTPEESAL